MSFSWPKNCLLLCTHYFLCWSTSAPDSVHIFWLCRIQCWWYSESSFQLSATGCNHWFCAQQAVWVYTKCLLPVAQACKADPGLCSFPLLDTIMPPADSLDSGSVCRADQQLHSAFDLFWCLFKLVLISASFENFQSLNSYSRVALIKSPFKWCLSCQAFLVKLRRGVNDICAAAWQSPQRHPANFSLCARQLRLIGNFWCCKQ